MFALGGGLALAFLFSLSTNLEERDLRIVLALIAAISACVIGVFVWRHLLHRPSPLVLASLLEQKHPPLAERLVSLVSLNESGNATALLPLLAEQTAAEIDRVDWRRIEAESSSRKRWLPTVAALASFGLLVALAPGFGDFQRRLFTSWFAADTAFAFHVTPGSGPVLQGQPVDIRVKMKQRAGEGSMPATCVLVRDGVTIELDAVEPGVFQTTLPNLASDTDYEILAGRHASGVYRLQAVEPLAFAQAPKVRATPPPYLPAITKEGSDTLLRYSQAEFVVALNRSVKQAKVVLKSDGDGSREISSPTASVAMTFAWLATQSGEMKGTLHAIDEHGFAFTLPLPSLRVRDDQPPRFRELLRVSGASPGSKETVIRPDDVLRVQTAVEDDEGLSRVEVEFRVNDGPALTVPWLDAAGKRELKIDGEPPLPRTLKSGDRLRFRLRAFDNRQLAKGQLRDPNGERHPASDLSPQSVLEPASATGDAWIECVVDAGSQPLREKEILAQSNEVQQKIAEIQRKLLQEQQRIEKIRRDTHQQPAVTAEQQRAMAEVQKQNRDIVQDLLDEGRKLAESPELAPLAEHFWNIAQAEMQRSAAALEQLASKDRAMEAREKDAQAAELAVEQARQKLDKLKEMNQRLAQDRLDQFQIEKLAKRQNDLAKQLQAAKLTEPELAELRGEQAKIAEQLQKLREHSRMLRDALAEKEAADPSKLAEQAKEMVEQQRMQAKQREQMRKDQAGPLEELAKRQADLAKRAQGFAKEQTGPKLDEAKQASQSLEQGDVPLAVQRQRETEKTLQSWSNQSAGIADAGDVREATARLARHQKELREDLEKLGEQLAQLDEPMLKQRLQELHKRQQSLADEVAKLPIDRANATLHSLHQAAGTDAKEASDRLGARDTLPAHAKMEQAEQQLENLARLVPASAKPNPALVKDPANRQKVERIAGFAKEQTELREAAERLLAEAKKSGGAGGAPGEEKEKLEELASELAKLSQQAGSEKEKAMAKEAAASVMEAQKLKQAAEELEKKGDKEQAKAMDAKAQEQLEIAAKKLEGMPKDKKGGDGDAGTAQLFKDAERDVKMAQKAMDAQPQQAAKATQQAGKSLAKLAAQAKQQTQRNVPRPVSPDQPSAQAGPGSGPPSAVPLQPLLAAHGAKSWGELPGEVKTRVMQDLRSRYGDEYATVIQRYFEQLAATPGRVEPKR